MAKLSFFRLVLFALLFSFKYVLIFFFFLLILGGQVFVVSGATSP